MPQTNDTMVEPGDAGVDLLSMTGGGLMSSGDIGMKLLAANGDVAKLRTLSVLRENEWREYDQAVVQVARGRYTMVKDLMAKGLRRKLTNPMGVTQMVWDRVNDMDDAQVDMTGEAASIMDRTEFFQDSIPVPIIHKGFKVNIRTLMASRRNGVGLDVTYAQTAAIKVVEMTEKLVISGAFSAGSNAGTVYGVTTYPFRNVGTLSTSWLGATPQQIFNDTNAMMAALEAANMYGPYGLYVPRSYMQVLRRDYDTTTHSGRSIQERLTQIEGLEYIKSNMFLTGNNVVMVQLTSDVIEMIDGIQPRIIEWQTNGGMTTHFKVLSILVPRIKRDGANQCGVAHFS
jgi:uncharacterized linocin/CFP29 family protein